MKDFLGILEYVRRYYILAILNVVSNLLSTVFSLVSLAMVIPFLTLLFDEKIGPGTPIPPVPDFKFTVNYVLDLFNHHFIRIISENGKVYALASICILVVVVFFFKNLFRYFALFELAPLRNAVVR